MVKTSKTSGKVRRPDNVSEWLAWVGSHMSEKKRESNRRNMAKAREVWERQRALAKLNKDQSTSISDIVINPPKNPSP